MSLIGTIKAGVKTVGTLFDKYTGAYQADQANKQSKELAMYGFDQEKQMIKEQNEYNSPMNQMKRYTDAGLNPNLIYGQGTPGNQATIAKYNAPDIKAAPRIDYLGMTLQALQGYQQIIKTQADTQNVQAHTNLVGLQSEKTIGETLNLKKLGLLTDAQVRNVKAQTVKTNQDTQQSKGLYPYQKTIAENQTKLQVQELAKTVYENEIRKRGLNPNDALPWRVIASLFQFLNQNRAPTFREERQSDLQNKLDQMLKQ